jgi:hypothetical protein
MNSAVESTDLYIEWCRAIQGCLKNIRKYNVPVGDVLDEETLIALCMALLRRYLSQQKTTAFTRPDQLEFLSALIFLCSKVNESIIPMATCLCIVGATIGRTLSSPQVLYLRHVFVF